MDRLTLTKLDGTLEDVEIIATFSIEKYSSSNYIIYKNDSKYFAAKYLEKDNNIELIHDLNKEEKEAIREIFDKLKKEVEI